MTYLWTEMDIAIWADEMSSDCTLTDEASSDCTAIGQDAVRMYLIGRDVDYNEVTRDIVHL